MKVMLVTSYFDYETFLDSSNPNPIKSGMVYDVSTDEKKWKAKLHAVNEYNILSRYSEVAEMFDDYAEIYEEFDYEVTIEKFVEKYGNDSAMIARIDEWFKGSFEDDYYNGGERRVFYFDVPTL